MLLAVHVLIAAHATHFLLAQRTLSPVEPSESMYALELGYVNAGLLFFALALLATLLFGRFFCGWGCHIVALQDLCAWALRKLGLKPKPFRSRTLVFFPFALAAYMFLWPTVVRRFLTHPTPPFPGFTNHLLTNGFWRTFPGPVIALLTFLVCGFAAVYFLGAKGFCTYGCPYGALFGLMDRVSPGRILVTNSCEQCGHCTAVCTSNVRVHEEVRLYGMVVDPGCMKCMDCVSVCPKNALHFGFARPSLLKGKPTEALRPRPYDLTLAEDVAAAVICLVAALAFRGLYDLIPLLTAAGLGILTAYLALKLWRLTRDQAVRILHAELKSAGRLRPTGWLFTGLALAWLAFTVHSAYVQWHRAWGQYDLDRTEVTWDDLRAGISSRRAPSPQHAQAAQSAFAHFSQADQYSLVGIAEVKLGLAWGDILHDDVKAAESHIRQAVALRPDSPDCHQLLFEFLLWQHRLPEAIAALQAKMDLEEERAVDHFQLAGLLVETGRPDEAVDHYTACLRLAPNSPEARYNLGALLRRLHRTDEAIAHLRMAHQLAPNDFAASVELGLAYTDAGATDEALRAFRNARETVPDDQESRAELESRIEQFERAQRVDRH